jgi:hypothetical protein
MSDEKQAMKLHEKVRDEYKRFLDALPELLTKTPGRWVVFRDGVAHGFFDDEQAAYKHAVATFGVQGGFVVAPVRPVETTPVTAGVMYSIP